MYIYTHYEDVIEIKGRKTSMATSALTIKDLSLFQDEVFSSTDLNRRAGEVLDHATKHPVTISRNKEQFALLKREQAAGLIKVAQQFEPTLELIAGALSAVEGKELPPSVAWMRAFDTDDLRKMMREIVVASIDALQETGDWDRVNAIIHEWHESALVVTSGVLDAAMKSPADESRLPDPRSITEASAEIGRSSRE
jgi:hypothetical protein